MEDKKKILFVEDELPLLNSYADILNTEGYETIKAEDGYIGLNKLEEHKDDIGLVFLDLMMEGIDGLEVLRRIKDEGDKFGSPRIIILTNMTSERVITEAFKIGADSYLIKNELEAVDLINEAKATLE